MALSAFNYLFWDMEKAIIPLALADFVVFVGLYAIDRGMKAEKKLVELEQKMAADKTAHHEQEKVNKNALKKKDRDISKKHRHDHRHDKHLHTRTHDNRPMGSQNMGATKKGH